MHKANGQLMFESQENSPEQLKNGKSLYAYRPQLNKQLLDAARKHGVNLQIGVEVEDIDIDRTTVTLKDGTKLTPDLIIAADGLASIVRKHIVDASQFRPYPSTGHNCYRFLLTKEQVENDEVLAPVLMDKDKFMGVNWAGPEAMLISYPVDYGRQYNMTLAHKQHLSDPELDRQRKGEESSYDHKVSRETAFETFKDFEPRAKRIIEMADPDAICVWKQRDMDELPTLSKNNTVLIGDAGHAVQPFGFSGAGMALEDAVTLQVLFPLGTTKEQIPARFKLYEQIRKPRVARVRQAGRDIGLNKHLGDANYTKDYRRFLAEHNAVTHAQEALAEP